MSNNVPRPLFQCANPSHPTSQTKQAKPSTSEPSHRQTRQAKPLSSIWVCILCTFHYLLTQEHPWCQCGCTLHDNYFGGACNVTRYLHCNFTMSSILSDCLFLYPSSSTAYSGTNATGNQKAVFFVCCNPSCGCHQSFDCAMKL